MTLKTFLCAIYSTVFTVGVFVSPSSGQDLRLIFDTGSATYRYEGSLVADSTWSFFQTNNQPNTFNFFFNAHAGSTTNSGVGSSLVGLNVFSNELDLETTSIFMETAFWLDANDTIVGGSIFADNEFDVDKPGDIAFIGDGISRPYSSLGQNVVDYLATHPSFETSDNGGGFGSDRFEIVVTAVPEPSAVSVLVLACAIFAVRRGKQISYLRY